MHHVMLAVVATVSLELVVQLLVDYSRLILASDVESRGVGEHLLAHTVVLGLLVLDYAICDHRVVTADLVIGNIVDVIHSRSTVEGLSAAKILLLPFQVLVVHVLVIWVLYYGGITLGKEVVL